MGGPDVTAFDACQRVMTDPVVNSRAIARTAAKTMIPGSVLGVRMLIGVARTISLLPTGLTRLVAKLNDDGIRPYDTMEVPDY